MRRAWQVVLAGSAVVALVLGAAAVRSFGARSSGGTPAATPAQPSPPGGALSKGIAAAQRPH